MGTKASPPAEEDSPRAEPLTPDSLSARQAWDEGAPFTNLLYFSFREPQDPSTEGTGSHPILHCGDGETDTGGQGGPCMRLSPLGLWPPPTTALSTETESHGLDTDTTSAAVGLDGLHGQCPGQDRPAQRLHGRQAPQGKTRP